MKKILLVLLFTATNVLAQSSAPAPVDPAAAPAPVAPVEKTVTPITTSPALDSNLERPDPASFNARLGVGMLFGPNAFWMTGEADAQLDKFVAIGPKLQFGTNSSTDFVFGSIGPRFTIPFSVFEIGLGTGFGFAYRNVAGFEFTNFLYNVAMNLDVFLFKNFSAGIGYNVNFTSAAADSYMSALTATAAFHF